MHPLSPPSPVLISRHHLPRNGSSSTSNGAANSNINRPSTGQIIANIENNPMHYERDWTLDDSSQSSFKPCLQGSGSMTPLPFHDSVHNMYENPVRSSSSTSGGGSGHNLNEAPSSSTSANNPNTSDLQYFKVNAQSLNYSNSAVFLENSDILNDAGYPKLYHRHSTIFMTPEINDNLDKFLGKDVRRYSDTRLLKQKSDEMPIPIFNVPNVTDVPLASVDQTFESNNITDIIFENSGHHFDPLELNIQEMLELDVRQNVNQSQPDRAKARHSLNNVSSVTTAAIVNCDGSGNFAENRKIFKSLPNLSGSSENLLQK